MASGPLNGVRVLELGQVIAAPLGCQLLADLGAEVIKIEPLAGDPWRHNAAFLPNESKSFQGLNRGKQSVAIDLARPEAQAAVHRLVETVDVVVVNYRPDVSVRLHVDYESLAAVKPDLVYVDNTAFGRQGEMATEPGYDIVVQAFAGTIAAVGKVDERGTPLVGPATADTTTGYAIAAGACAALFHRAMTGEGQKVETSLLINALTVHMSQFAAVPAGDAEQRARFGAALAEARANGTSYADFLPVQTSILRPGGGNLYYRCYLTADGAIAIGALSAALRAKVRAALGIDHNRDEPGYDVTSPAQQAIDRELTAQLEERIRAEPSDYWIRLFHAGGVPVSRVNFVPELIDDPHLLANDYVVELTHDVTGPQRMAAPPWKMSATPPAPQGAAPPLGRDTDAVLAALGYSEREVAALRASGVIP